ncbi:hypothetical protein AO498_00580 [Algoriphagus sanaruensis]|uniref:Uncharacterized protein n=1 Tax=Algoriphagus sanaruensis TaxID=1727163 RepID=A0A142EIB1_9BACT|nr:hypothetical protein AO498_00580 [Algoriphagus sanaruensis]
MVEDKALVLKNYSSAIAGRILYRSLKNSSANYKTQESSNFFNFDCPCIFMRVSLLFIYM